MRYEKESDDVKLTLSKKAGTLTCALASTLNQQFYDVPYHGDAYFSAPTCPSRSLATLPLNYFRPQLTGAMGNVMLQCSRLDLGEPICLIRVHSNTIKFLLTTTSPKTRIGST